MAHLQRLYCNDCGLTRQEAVKFADEKKVTPVSSNDS